MKKKRFLIDELGRDKMAENAAQNGCKLQYHTLDDSEEYLNALTQKIVSVLESIFDSQTKEQVVQELAELDEVMHAFRKLIDVDQSEVDAMRKLRLAQEGGFEKRCYLEHIEVPHGTKEYEYYMSESEKYPEIVEELGKSTKG